MAPPTLIFHYDISCPFAYLASLKLPALAARHPSVPITYRPVLLGAIYRATAAPQGAAGSASDTFNPTKRDVTSKAFQRTIKRLGAELRQPERHPMKTTRALRLLYCLEDGPERRALTGGLYRAYWVEGGDVGDVEVLKSVVEKCQGLETGTRERLLGLIRNGDFEGAEQRRELEEATAQAVERGAFGVPSFWLEEERWVDAKGQQRKGRLYWGQDRMHFVERVLYELEGGAAGRSLEASMPRCVPLSQRRIPEGEEVKMQFWYDFSSPWAFLGWTQLARLQRTFGQRLKIEMKPFLLGILFREIGAPNLPSAAVSETKRLWSQLDHVDWCKWWNAVNEQQGSHDKPITFHWADVFPIRTPTALRAVIVEPRLVDVLFRACWERNLEVAKDAILHKVIAEAGFDADNIMAKANSADVKAELRAQTKEAKDTGLCGVPSYRIFRRKSGQSERDWKLVSDIIWGQDEMVVVEDIIAGWDGQSRVTDVEAEPKARL